MNKLTKVKKTNLITNNGIKIVLVITVMIARKDNIEDTRLKILIDVEMMLNRG